jgi:hypothetical protein
LESGHTGRKQIRRLVADGRIMPGTVGITRAALRSVLESARLKILPEKHRDLLRRERQPME